MYILKNLTLKSETDYEEAIWCNIVTKNSTLTIGVIHIYIYIYIYIYSVVSSTYITRYPVTCILRFCRRHVQPVRVTCLHVSLEFDEGLKSSACQTTEGAHEILDLDNGQIDRMFCTDYPFMFFIISEQTGAILQIGRILRPTLIY